MTPDRAGLVAVIALLILPAASSAHAQPSATAGGGALCACTSSARATSGTAGTRSPTVKPPGGCGVDTRTCAQKAEAEARLLEADAQDRAGRWSNAAAKYLEILKSQSDSSTKEAALSGYRRTSGFALAPSAEDDARLLEAQTEENAGHWAAAAEKYLDALKHASDATTREAARAGYAKAAGVTTSRWWRFSRFLPPIWWGYRHPDWVWLLLAGLLLILLTPRIFGGDGVVGLGGRLLQGVLRPRFSGRARIIATTTLTNDAPAALFAAQLPHSADEVKRRWERVCKSFLSGSTTLLSLPTALASQIASDIPEIKGISIGKFAALALVLGQYFTWRVESQVGFCPDSPASSTRGRMRAYATLRWAWYLKDSFAVAPPAAYPSDFEAASYAIAARVLGAAQRKELR